jgi:hypothetical protein
LMSIIIKKCKNKNNISLSPTTLHTAERWQRSPLF